jgi:ABC-2 type transport system permease protein
MAPLLVRGVPVAISGLLAVAIIANGDVAGAAATGAGLLIGASAYAAIFTWAGLATRHALIFGLVYVFIWEAVLAAYLDGIRRRGLWTRLLEALKKAGFRTTARFSPY